MARVAPARRYDHLDPDFNRSLFLVGMLALSAGTYALGMLASRKDRATAWR